MLIWLILSCLLAIQAPQKQEAGAKVEPSTVSPYVERDQRQFSFFPGGKIEILQGLQGSLTIIGWQRASVLAEVERIVYRLPEQEAKALPHAYPIQLRWTQTSATIQTSGPPGMAAPMEVNLTLYVPKEKTDIKAQLTQGDFAVGGINGWIEVTVNEGSLRATALSGYFSGLTRRGNITAQLSGSRWSGYEFAGSTQQGNIELQLPLRYSAALVLDTKQGAITIDYPGPVVEGQQQTLEPVNQKEGSRLSSPIGEGGAPIRLATTSGNINVSPRKD
jgi:hypothetical protein